MSDDDNSAPPHVADNDNNNSDNERSATPPPSAVTGDTVAPATNNDGNNDDEIDDVYANTLKIAMQLQQDQDEHEEQEEKNNNNNIVGPQGPGDHHHGNQQQEEDPEPQPPISTQVELQEGDSLCHHKFEAVAKLGAGESSTVWLARSQATQKIYAIKIFKCEPAIFDTVEYEKKINEYLVRQLSQPDVMRAAYNNSNSNAALPSSSRSSKRSVTSPPSSSAAPHHQQQPPNFSHLPFAAQDAWMRVALMHLPKAAVHKTKEPSFMMTKSATAASRRRVQKQHQHQQDVTAAAIAGAEVTSPNARKPPQQQHSSSSRSTAAASVQSSNPLTTGEIGVCPLVGHSVHHDPLGRPHACLIFESMGPSVEWMMSVFSYKGVPLPVVVQIIESACESLTQLAAVHVVSTDFKPENLLFKHRDFTELEAVAKRSVAGHGVKLGLFSCAVIDFGLSFLLPLAQRAAPPRSHTTTTTTTTTNKSSQQREQSPLSPHSSYSSSNNSNSTVTSPTRAPTSSQCLSVEELTLLNLCNYRRGLRVQTREYRAPEVILGGHLHSPGTDVWSVGCTAWELVTGNFLFDPKADCDTQGIGVLPEDTDVYERLLDLRHLWEMRRVCGDAPVEYLSSKFGEGGTGVHAGRFIDKVTSELRFLCECKEEDDDDEDENDENNQNDNDNDDDDHQQQQQNKKKEEKKDRRAGLDPNFVHFCDRCQRMLVPPPDDGLRDLEGEAKFKFPMDAEGLRYFVDFVLQCCQWRPEDRPKASDLLRHPFFVIWARNIM